MSHVTDIGVEITDLDCLRKACERMGLYLVKKDAYKWYGRHVGDYKLPVGFTKEDMGKCEYAIGIPGRDESYEVGVVRRRDGKPGYTLHYDFWRGGFGIEQAVGKDCYGLVSRYSAEVAKQAALNQGMMLMGEQVFEDGTVEVLVAVQG